MKIRNPFRREPVYDLPIEEIARLFDVPLGLMGEHGRRPDGYRGKHRAAAGTATR